MECALWAAASATGLERCRHGNLLLLLRVYVEINHFMPSLSTLGLKGIGVGLGGILICCGLKHTPISPNHSNPRVPKLGLKVDMRTMFRMSGLGLLSFYVGIEVQQNSNGVTC
ncbi:hypothetical protein U9M48_025976 [Paspalum notatum var. saurae]|uniref:Uncharacterized protein n=1 Tax=Paspalum notatum var. saurae TaxID=547442 RepID=A0AAQ3TRM4_PASNO